MRLSPDTVLKVVRPLYGIPESGLHWYLTYLENHVDNLGMNRTKADPCVTWKSKGNCIQGLIVLQVDESLGMGTQGFLKEEEEGSMRFKSKPRTPIAEEGT